MKILEWLETPVTIVGAAAGGKRNGMAAAWVSQVSFSPPLLMVSIAPERYTHELITKSKAFAISVLHAGQEAIARDLGLKSGRDADKLAKYSLKTARTGSPILAEARAYYDCRLLDSHKAGDHFILVGEVIDDGLLKGGELLVFKAGDYFG